VRGQGVATTHDTGNGPHLAVLKEYLEYLKDAGVTEHWGPKSFMWARGKDATAAPLPIPGGKAQETAPSLNTLEEVREYLGECTRCKLHKGRTNIVFGVGNPDARLVFVGEGPGRDEDIKGEPFVGRAGQLLTDIIEKGMKLRREDVYIANVVKCRPPDNRNPEDDEIAACEPFLLRQLDVIRPKLICALGRFAAQTLLKTKEPISSLRGKVFKYHDITLIPTFHPAYLLRNPADKVLVWQDVQKLMALYKEYDK
jgi:uracil-DNA glycosylase family 4